MKQKILLFFAFLTISAWSFGQATINFNPESEDYQKVTTEAGQKPPGSVLTYTKDCNTFAVPFTEGFESTAVNEIPECWTSIINTTATDAFIKTLSSGAYQGTNCLFMYSNSDTESEMLFITPEIEGGAAGMHASFWFWGDSDLIIGTMSDTTDASFFTPYDTVSPSGTYGDYIEGEVSFTNYTGTDAFIAIKLLFNSWYGSSHIDEILIGVIPTCEKPTNLASDSTSNSSALVSWLENGEATTWNIEYGYAGFTPTGIATVVANENPFLLTGLESNTEYDFYVQADCGSGDLSYWSQGSSFATLCDPQLVPIVENFDDLASNQDLPDCWSSYVMTSGNAAVVTSAQSSYSPVYSLKLTCGNDEDATVIAIGPSIADDKGAAGKWVRFWSWGYAPEVALGTMSNPTDPESFVVHTIISLNNIPGGWVKYEVDLSNYTGNAEYIAFKGIYTSPNQRLYIDNVTINHPPTCPYPTNQYTGDLTSSSAVIGWSENGEATTWHIEYGEEGFMPSGIPTFIVNANPYELTGLESNSSYDWYVQAFCEEGDSSEWEGPYNLVTLCGSQDVPLIEGFDGGSAPNLPDCWSSIVNSSSSNASVDLWTSISYSAPACLRINNYTDEDPEALMAISPMLIEPVGDLWIRFFARGGADNLIVGALSDPLDASTFEPIDTVFLLNFLWNEYEINLDGYAGDANFLAFQASYSDALQYVFIDNIRIDHPPSCQKPSDQWGFGSSETSAILGWDENGDAIMWNIEYDYSGFIPTGIANAVANSNPVELTDLDEATYYDYYVQANCGSGDVSFWVGPYTFKTLCSPVVLADTNYYEDFEDLTAPNYPPCISVKDANADGDTWQGSSDNPHSGNSHMQGNSSNNQMDDWFFSAPLELQGGQTYNVNFYYTNNWTSYHEALELQYGIAPIADSMTSEVFFQDHNINYGSDNYQDTMVQFTVPVNADGIYYVGWHSVSSPGQWHLYVDDVMIDSDNSLIVVATADPDTICLGEESQLLGEGVGGSGAFTYSWTSDPPGFNSNEPNPVVTPEVSTNYILEIYDGIVSSFDMVYVHVKELPGTSGPPTGITYICASWGWLTTYNTSGATGANWYDWSIDPTEAGTPLGTGTSVSVDWTEGWLGMATLYVTGMKDECAGQQSTGLNINVYLPEVSVILPAYVAIGEPPFELTGGSPPGGEYSGTGVSNGIFDPAEAGLGNHVITYTYTDLNLCANSAVDSIYITEFTGIIDKYGENSVSIYPNPNTGTFTLKLKSEESKSVKIKIFNVLNEVVYFDDNVLIDQTYTTKINLGRFVKGVYYLHINDNNTKSVNKILIQ